MHKSAPPTARNSSAQEAVSWLTQRSYALSRATPSRMSLVEELDVPVGSLGQSEEGQPLAVGDPPCRPSEEGRPAWTQRPFHHSHVRLLRRAPAFTQTTSYARAYHILPSP